MELSLAVIVAPSDNVSTNAWKRGAFGRSRAAELAGICSNIRDLAASRSQERMVQRIDCEFRALVLHKNRGVATAFILFETFCHFVEPRLAPGHVC